MLDPIDARTLRRVFDLLAKTNASTDLVAAAAGVPEYLVIGILSGHRYGRERMDYGSRRLGVAAGMRGVELHPQFAPPMYRPMVGEPFPPYVLKDFRAAMRLPTNLSTYDPRQNARY